MSYALVMQYGGQSKDYEKFPMLDAEWDFISAALPRLLTGDNNRLQTVCEQLIQFLNFTGRWDNLIWVHEQAETRALSANDKENAGWQSIRAGYTYCIRNQPTEALACAARASQHWHETTPRNKAIAVELRGLGHKLNHDYPAAIAAYHEVVEFHRSISSEGEDIARALNVLADAERMNKDYSAASDSLRLPHCSNSAGV